VNGGLGEHDKKSHEDAKRYEYPIVIERPDVFADEGPGGKEADAYPGQKYCKSEEGVYESYAYAREMPERQAQGENLE
jgi:hypothetical protein